MMFVSKKLCFFGFTVMVSAVLLVCIHRVGISIEMKQMRSLMNNIYSKPRINFSKSRVDYPKTTSNPTKMENNFSKMGNHSLNVITTSPKMGTISTKPGTSSSKVKISSSGLESNSLETMTNTTTNGKYLFYECSHRTGSCGGWGDRQKGIVMNYLISLITRRKFGIIITSPACKLTDYFQSNLVDWNFNLSVLNNLTSQYINKIDDHGFYYSLNMTNFSSMMTKDVVYFAHNYEFTSSLQAAPPLSRMKGWTNNKVFAHVLNKLFTLNKTVATLLQSFMNKAKPSEHWKLMCAQIRMGKNPTIPNDSETRNTMETVEVVWKFLKTNFTCDKCKIFISTDSEDVRKQAKQLFPGHIIDMAGNIGHLDKSKRSTCASFQKLVLDQQVLSRCDSLIISHSGFGRIAAYLRNTEANLFCLIKGKIVKCLPHELLTLYKVRGNR